MRTGIFLVLLGLLAGPAMAQHGAWREGVQPLDRLLPEIRRSHPGKFYDAEGPLRGPDGEIHYRLKWMTPDGRLIWLDTDARTGRVLGVVQGHASPDYDRDGPEPFPGGWRREPHDRYGGERDQGQRYEGHHGGGHGGHYRHGR